MDEELVQEDGLTVGQRLRAAREDKGLSLEDIAAQTRIPQRHLESIESADWEKLPAPTYTMGFAKSYASAVGLDRTEVGDQLRSEMGGHRPAPITPAEVFEPADPARTMPKWLVFAAIAAVIVLVLVMSWLNDRSLEQSDSPATNVAAEAPAATPAQPEPAPPQAAQGPVVLTANEPVWLSIKDGTAKIKEGTMQAGESFQVPATATAPLMTVGKPEALKISVGTTVAPPVGPAGRVASKVSLLPADLVRGGSPAAPEPAATNAVAQ